MKSLVSRVDFPVPLGPESTMGCRDIGAVQEEHRLASKNTVKSSFIRRIFLTRCHSPLSVCELVREGVEESLSPRANGEAEAREDQSQAHGIFIWVGQLPLCLPG